MTFAYTVRSEFSDAATAAEWLAWMRGEHLAHVCEAGATDAEVVKMDAADPAFPHAYEARYHFASRAAFAEYERDHAPRLRAEGLRLFPVERGIHYARTTGEVVIRHNV